MGRSQLRRRPRDPDSGSGDVFETVTAELPPTHAQPIQQTTPVISSSFTRFGELRPGMKRRRFSPKSYRAPSFRILSGERVGYHVTQSARSLGAEVASATSAQDDNHSTKNDAVKLSVNDWIALAIEAQPGSQQEMN